ncbi:MAG: alpha/beta hydrolase [Pseudomonadota bacterium]
MSEQQSPDSYTRPLAAYNGEKPPAPDWFERALEEPMEEGGVDVNGARIAYLAWGRRGAPGLLFVHGGRAHAHWWRPFAHFFSSTFRVAALNLSGMGDSSWRDAYSMPCFVDEIFAVSEAAGLYEAGQPLVVGHSFGGLVSLGAVEQAGERLRGVVIIDSPVLTPSPDEDYHYRARNKTPPRGRRVYEREKDLLARFRFLPDQDTDHHYLVDYIARTAVTSAPFPDEPERMGVSWKFDPGAGSNFDLHFKRDLFLAARCPLAFIYGGKSMFYNEETQAHLSRQTVGRSPMIVIPDAEHHIMIDQPIAFVSALRALFAAWPVRIGV